MATRFPYPRLLALCGLAMPVIAGAQDAASGVVQASTTHSSSTSSTSETVRSTTASDPPQSAVGSGNAITTETTTTGNSRSSSRSDNSSVELDIGYHREDDDDLDGDRRHGRMPSREDYLFGDWTLGQENGSSCTITLKDSPWFGGYGAWVPAGCPDGFFAVNRWLLSGNQLLLTDTNNQVIGRFRSSGGGRWSGHRESDGARLYLNPARR
ncbi:hypothetical protein C1924_10600 [Stenotrophomonas sp. ESTM1D_MKCIP4_1]|uniref:AprI/Inh family metalloprotease inhibitor n=1 Tax=Stenotrophomonas sp. ESTM1D_MKCIP4_1 TaxID=2072414 RepID=UPI000D5408CA|nr:AprI/Inh family metalloprotease inhibitor [Stenotrophomonas sp. ESTM1D_MKCIP4_1]AWH53597.1 hypothetical protein C1924_10600 [Stenotrophomonas sp. ESTM1D_MKCIP4_1]